MDFKITVIDEAKTERKLRQDKSFLYLLFLRERGVFLNIFSQATSCRFWLTKEIAVPLLSC